MFESTDLDPKSVRRQFDRRGKRALGADFLFREVEARALERLSYTKITPECVLELGCGAGQGLTQLRKRFPAASLVGVDLSTRLLGLARAAHAPGRSRMLDWWRGGSPKPPVIAAADAASLPIADASADLLWSNLTLHWLADIPAAFVEWYRVIRPGGLLSFSLFGVDTLIELRRAGARIMRFHDMHDIGDALVDAGFAEPVLDVDRLTLRYHDPDKLLREIHAMAGNARSDRFRGLLGRSALGQWHDVLRASSAADGGIDVSFEIIHAHAWCPARKRRSDGAVPVDFVPPIARRR